MKNIEAIRQIVIKRRTGYLQELRQKKIDVTLSSLSSFRTLLFNNFSSGLDIIKDKFSESTINKEVFLITDGQSTLIKDLPENEIEDWNIYFIMLDRLKSNLKI